MHYFKLELKDVFRTFDSDGSGNMDIDGKNIELVKLFQYVKI